MRLGCVDSEGQPGRDGYLNVINFAQYAVRLRRIHDEQPMEAILHRIRWRQEECLQEQTRSQKGRDMPSLVGSAPREQARNAAIYLYGRRRRPADTCYYVNFAQRSGGTKTGFGTVRGPRARYRPQTDGCRMACERIRRNWKTLLQGQRCRKIARVRPPRLATVFHSECRSLAPLRHGDRCCRCLFIGDDRK
jgi:hypothetical protein